MNSNNFENEKYRLVLCYRPPNLNYDDSMLLFEAISSMCSSTRHTVLLTGDFNLPDIKWNKREFFSEGTLPYEFISTINLIGLCQLVRTPTLDMNTLDLVFWSYKSHVSSLTVNEPFSTSDHNYKF